MRLLLDTHIALWLLFRPDKLSKAEQAIVAQPWERRAVSVVSLWELRVKWSRHFVSGVRKGPVDPADLLFGLQQARIEVVELTAATCVAELDPPFDHSDPFDQLLLAHAQQEGYRLLTRDEKMKAHPVALAAR